MFGCNTKPFRNLCYADALEKAGLPVAFNALSDQDHIAQNMMLIDQKLGSTTGTHGRRLVAAFDCTYLLHGHQQGGGRQTARLVGQPWTPEAPDLASVELSEDMNLQTMRMATDMLLEPSLLNIVLQLLSTRLPFQSCFLHTIPYITYHSLNTPNSSFLCFFEFATHPGSQSCVGTRLHRRSCACQQQRFQFTLQT